MIVVDVALVNAPPLFPNVGGERIAREREGRDVGGRKTSAVSHAMTRYVTGLLFAGVKLMLVATVPVVQVGFEPLVV